jgi:hypothetical protein
MRSQISNRLLAVLGGLSLVVLLSAGSCDNSNDAQNTYSDNQGKAAQKKWGDPKVTNFTEYQMAIEIAGLRDQENLVMNAYIKDANGPLRCLGKVVGYGLPYSTQITPPYASTSGGSTNPVREPNALFMPESAEATWVRLIDPKTGKSAVTYVEDRVLITPIELPCKSLSE